MRALFVGREYGWGEAPLAVARIPVANVVAIMAAHRALLPALSPEMFARWLALWRQSAAEMMSPADATILIAKAEDLAARMGDALFGNHKATAKETRS